MITSSTRFAFVAAIMSLLSSSTTAQSTTTSAPKSITTLNCYKAAYPLVQQGSYTFQTSGYCQQQCADMNKPVMAITQGSTCYCGDELPPTSNQVSNSSCNTPCNGFDQQMCGGDGFWQFYLTGLTNDVDTASGNGASATNSDGSSSTSASPSVITKAGQTVVVTASASPSSSSSKSGGSSKVGIAVGVVVGLIAIAAIVGGTVLFLKRRRRLAIEEEHRRNAAVSSFVHGKPGSMTSSDQRLDPSINSHLRHSIGSIADERDFSRRILQVRNPDRDSKASNLA